MQFFSLYTVSLSILDRLLTQLSIQLLECWQGNNATLEKKLQTTVCVTLLLVSLVALVVGKAYPDWCTLASLRYTPPFLVRHASVGQDSHSVAFTHSFSMFCSLCRQSQGTELAPQVTKCTQKCESLEKSNYELHQQLHEADQTKQQVIAPDKVTEPSARTRKSVQIMARIDCGFDLRLTAI